MTAEDTAHRQHSRTLPYIVVDSAFNDFGSTRICEPNAQGPLSHDESHRSRRQSYFQPTQLAMNS